jgi:CheY-like chemotaxis protein/HPt (histidine-containing phosphotransfer) domain-containing protein
MDESFAEHIFDKFSQGEISTARRYGGTGLGMAITRELINLMNGTIAVSSKKGVGTVVEINLELERGNEKEIKSSIVAEGFDALKHKDILLVEDNDMSRLVAFNSLSNCGVNVTEASNGLEAIGKLKSSGFDLILMDLQMPVMGGIEATNFIRKEMKLDIPVIALTAHAFKAEIDRCMEAGMNDYVTKPFEENTLLGTILRNLPAANAIEKTVTEPGKPDPKKLYNLDYIVQFSRGNPDFVRKMIRLFIEQIPAAVDEIKTAYKESNLETVSRTAHRIKPNIDNFGIEDLKKDIRTIESLAKEGIASDELEILIGRLENVIRKVVSELEQDRLTP